MNANHFEMKPMIESKRNFGVPIKLWMIISLLLSLSCSRETDIELLAKAKQHHKDGEYKTAIINLKNALQVNTNSAEARYFLGENYLVFRNGDAAEKQLRKARELGFDSDRLVIALASALNMQGKYRETIELLSNLNANTKQNKKRKLILLAEANVAGGDIREAETLIKSAFEISPNGDEALLLQTKIRIKKGQLKLAHESSEKLIREYPENVEGLLIRSDLYLIEKKIDAALKDLRTALSLEEGKKTPILSSYIKLKLADVLLANGDLVTGEKYLNDLLQRDKSNPHAKYLLATVAYKKKDLKKAEAYLQEVLRILPDHKPALLLLGAVNFGAGHLEQADMHLSRILSSDPTNVAALRILGATQLKLNRPDQAKELLDPVLKQDPNDFQALNVLGLASVAQGELAEGVEYLERAKSANPQSGAVRNRLASLYLSLGDVDQAIEELESTLKTLGNNYRSKTLLILSYVRKKKYVKAHTLAELLYHDNPDQAHALNLLATVRIAQGQVSKAKTLLEQGQEKFSSDEAILKNLLRLDIDAGDVQVAKARLVTFIDKNPRKEMPHVTLASIKLREGDHQAAIHLLREYISKEPKSITARLLLARIYLSQNRLKEANTTLREAEFVDAKNVSVNYMFGIMDLRRRNPESAIRRFETVIKNKPSSAEAYHLLAQAHLLQKNNSKAKQSLRQSLKYSPDLLHAAWLLAQLEMRDTNYEEVNRIIAEVEKRASGKPIVDILRGDLFARKGEYKKALQFYAKAEEKAKNSGLIQRQFNVLKKLDRKKAALNVLKSWLKENEKDVKTRKVLAVELQNAGDIKNAAVQYKKVLKYRESDMQTLNNLAWLLFEKGDPEAIDYARRAFEVAPDNGAVLDTLGWIYVKSGQLEKGLTILRDAIHQSTSNPDIRYHYAYALNEQGNKEMAQQELEKLLAKPNKFTSKKSAQALLKSLQ